MPEYLIKLRPTPSDIPAEIRLRRLLKIALRSCQLRCTSVSETPNASEQDGRRDVGATDDPAETPIVRQRASGRRGTDSPDSKRSETDGR
jgi:hypothetical protein